MDTFSPVHADAFQLLLLDLNNHLCEAECLASKPGRWSGEDIDSVRRLTPDLLVGIRGLLIAHKITPSGDCRTCPVAWPCPVVTTIHALVEDPDCEFAAILRRVDNDGVTPPPSRYIGSPGVARPLPSTSAP